MAQPTLPTPHLDAGSSPGCSTPNHAPANVLGKAAEDKSSAGASVPMWEKMLAFAISLAQPLQLQQFRE